MQGVLSLAKLAAGGAGYYLDQVAAGAEEYYTGAGEAPGVWVGSASGALGLAGQVDAADLHALLSGVAPGSGARLAAGNRRVPGFDLTFSAPKSVSLLYALGGSEASQAVVAAHEAAVAAAAAYLEREACWTRRGHNGIVQERGGGFVAAAFRHRTSRAGDPQLHTHVLIANLAQGEDGRWRTLDGRHLYQHQRTAGFLYQAQLRAELTRTLGVSWQPMQCGMAEITGVSDHVLRVFSRRRQQILEHLAKHQQRGARAGEIGRVERAMDRMNAHGRITHASNFHEACHQMVEDWQTARSNGDQVLLLAARRRDVAFLNELAQAARLEAGELQPESMTYGRVTVHVGDTVMTLRNDRRRGVLNGQRSTVTALDRDGITIETETGVTAQVPRRNLEREEVQLAYAATIHKSQGATTDRSLVLATDDLGYEAGYTALTRGRDENHLYLTQPLTGMDEIRHLRRSTSKHLAHERSAGIER